MKIFPLTFNITQTSYVKGHIRASVASFVSFKFVQNVNASNVSGHFVALIGEFKGLR
jgi:hypothetical protein